MPLVTVVVPVYNVENYLSRCVDSILAQTLRDIEVILVDDGSTDTSGQIADEYALKDSRIQVIHKKNGGTSSTRNVGMRKAVGKYIGFVDSDDWVELETFERLFQTAEQFNTDVVMFDFIRKTPHGDQPHTENIDKGFYDRNKIINEIFPNLIMGENLDYGPVVSACTCFYRHDFLCQYNIKFDEQIIFSEDVMFNSIVMENATTFYYLKESFYNYFHNENSVTTTYTKKKWQNVKLLNNKIRNYFSTITDYDFEIQIKRHMVYFACNTLNQVCCSSESAYEKRNEIRRILMDPQLSSAMVGLTYSINSLKFKGMLWLMKMRLSLLYSLLFIKR